MNKTEDFYMKFVRRHGSDPDPAMAEAFKIMQDLEMGPEWIDHADVLDVEKSDRNVAYVMDPFEGPAFEHLKLLSCRVFGPQCVIASLTFKIELPHKKRPIYNICFKGTLISCTNLQKEIRDRMHRLVELMAGETSRDLTDNVTHIIAGEVGSQKYQVAACQKIPIMAPEWVDNIWQAAQHRYLSCVEEEILAKYRCPIFRGVVATVSGLVPDERRRVKRFIEQEGGVYTGEMKINECTHLILNEPKGQKYDYACKWMVHIVNVNWLFESLEKGYAQNEKLYPVTGTPASSGVKTSTPEKSRLSAMKPNITDISAISSTHIDETVFNHTRFSDITQDAFASLNLTGIARGPYLRGCSVFLSRGISGSLLQKCLMILHTGGAVVTKELGESLTHIVMDDRVESEVSAVSNMDLRPHVVCSLWLAECAKHQQLVSEEKFLSPHFMVSEIELPKIRISGRIPTTSKQPSRESNTADTTETTFSLVDKKNGGTDNDIQLLSQYLQNDGNETVKNEKNVSQPEDEVDGNDLTNRPSADVSQQHESDELGAEEGGVFARRTFVFCGFSESDTEALVQFLQQAGGICIQAGKRKIPDYAVVPILGCPVEMTVGQVVTNAWMQMCVEAEELFPVENNPIFQPMEIDETSRPLEGCVLSISGYCGVERDCLTHIAAIMGAECQEYFVRKANKKLKGSTHLIVKEPSGSKYTAAKNWNIPAVAKEWLFACARSGKREDENLFDIDNPDIPSVGLSSLALQQGKRGLSSAEDKSTPSVDCRTKSACGERSFADISAAPGKDSTSVDCHTKSACGEQSFADISAAPRKDSTSEARQSVLPASADPHSRQAEVYGEGGRNSTGGNPSVVPKLLGNAAVSDKADPTDDAMSTEPKKGKGTADSTLEKEYSVSLTSCALQTVAEEPKTGRELPTPLGKAEEQCHSTVREQKEMKSHSGRQNTAASTEESSKRSLVKSDSMEKVPSSSSEQNKDSQKSSNPMSSAKAMAQKQTAGHIYLSQKENITVAATTNRIKTVKTPAVEKKGRSRVEELQRQRREPIVFDSPSVYMAPGYKTNFNLKGLFDALKTPEEEKRRESLSLEQVFAHHIKEGVQASSVRSNADLIPIPSDLSQQDRGPLDRVVICVSKKLGVSQTEYNEIVVELGGDYVWQYSDSCTHFIFQGRTNDLNKEFRQARSHGKIIVSPYWLYACREQRCRVDESMFPHNYNPNLNLGGVVTTETPGRGLRRSARGSNNTPVKASHTPARPRPSTPVGDNPPASRSLHPAGQDGALSMWQESVLEMQKWQSPSAAIKRGLGKQKESVTGVGSLERGSRRKQEGEAAAESNGSRLHASPGSTISPIKDKGGDTSKIPSDEEVGQVTRQEDEEKQEMEMAAAECGGSLEIRESMSKMLESLKALGNSNSSRKSGSKKRNRRNEGSSSGGQLNTSGTAPEPAPAYDDSPWPNKTKTDEPIHTTESVPVEGSQVITWDDPTGRMEKERLAHKLECGPTLESTEDFMAHIEMPDNQEDDSSNSSHPVAPKVVEVAAVLQVDKSPTPDPPPLAFHAAQCVSRASEPQPIELLSDDSSDSVHGSGKPIILMSGMSAQEKIEFAEVVEQLGGTVLDRQQFDSACTHVVVAKPYRNEKFLAAVATGKWVLHKSYLIACRSEGRFVKEENHEWGNPAMSHLMKTLDTNTFTLVQSAHTWRQKLQKMKQRDPSCLGAFQGWRVLLLTEAKKESNFRRLLTAGGAAVVNVRPPLSPSALLEVTHVFVEVHKARLAEADMLALAQASALVLKPEFIAAHLSDDPAPNAASFVPPDIEKLRSSFFREQPGKKRKSSKADNPLDDSAPKRPRR